MEREKNIRAEAERHSADMVMRHHLRFRKLEFKKNKDLDSENLIHGAAIVVVARSSSSNQEKDSGGQGAPKMERTVIDGKEGVDEDVANPQKGAGKAMED
ncbi:unnamed protein product [Caenorhabditis nigoni]